MTVARRVRDFVTGLMPFVSGALTPDEQALGVHLRGNTALYESLTKLITVRIGGRANSPVPTDPQVCHASLSRDNELRWLLSRLSLVYHSPVSQPENDGEQPA